MAESPNYSYDYIQSKRASYKESLSSLIYVSSPRVLHHRQFIRWQGIDPRTIDRQALSGRWKRAYSKFLGWKHLKYLADC
jgi:hypothetical protein